MNHGQTGQALVEFALASILFFTIIFLTLDFGRAIYQYSQLSNAVREGARVAKVDPTNVEGEGGIKDRVQKTAKGIDIPASSISVCCGSDLGETVTVEVDYQFDLLTEDFLSILIPGITVPLFEMSSTVAIE